LEQAGYSTNITTLSLNRICNSNRRHARRSQNWLPKAALRIKNDGFRTTHWIPARRFLIDIEYNAIAQRRPDDFEHDVLTANHIDKRLISILIEHLHENSPSVRLELGAGERVLLPKSFLQLFDGSDRKSTRL